MTLTVSSLSELVPAARHLIQQTGSHKVWLFYGEMGAGKTTLIKALCTYLGVEDPTSSPTFSIVNEYAGPQGPIYHFDFYRIQSEQEALDLGYEEYFYSGQYCFVEWPERIPSLLPEDAVSVHIEVVSPDQRAITLDLP